MLIAAFSIPAVMLIDVLGAVLAVAALALVSIPNPEKAAGEQRHVVREMLEGLQTIGASRALRAITAPIMICVLVWVPVGTLFPLMVSAHFGTAWHASLVEFLFAGGLLGSALLLGVWGGMDDKPAMISLAMCALGVVLAASGLLPPTAFAAFAVLSTVMGFTGNCFSVPYTALVQSSVPAASLGGVFSLIAGLTALATPSDWRWWPARGSAGGGALVLDLGPAAPAGRHPRLRAVKACREGRSERPGMPSGGGLVIAGRDAPRAAYDAVGLGGRWEAGGGGSRVEDSAGSSTVQTGRPPACQARSTLTPGPSPTAGERGGARTAYRRKPMAACCGRVTGASLPLSLRGRGEVPAPRIVAN